MRAAARSIDEYMSSVTSLALIMMPFGNVIWRSATWLKPRSTAKTACAEIGSLLKYFLILSSLSAAYSRTACEASMCRNVVESCMFWLHQNYYSISTDSDRDEPK
jgi:hypothetical protein